MAFYPGMKLGLLLLLVVNATEVAVAWGRQNGSFLQSAIYWGVASLLIFWYYALRDAGNGSLVIFDHYLGGLPLPRSLPFWAFLLGWVFSGLDLSNFKAWVPWIETVSRWCRYPINCTAFLTMDLPRIPLMVRAFGTILMVGSGCLILLDLFAGRWIGED
ncbi:MAG: hypothetical protein LBR61_01020 [Synergistaceae bacterium]|nr:hypothetical protein [Synergistaceae bacterium]